MDSKRLEQLGVRLNARPTWFDNSNEYAARGTSYYIMALESDALLSELEALKGRSA